MKRILRFVIACIVSLMGFWAFIHRRLITAALTHSPLPEPPQWHKTLLKRFHS